MVTNTKLDFVLIETPREREEMFPMQEQMTGPARNGTLRQAQGSAEKPAAVIFAERLARCGSDIAAPVFIP